MYSNCFFCHAHIKRKTFIMSPLVDYDSAMDLHLKTILKSPFCNPTPRRWRQEDGHRKGYWRYNSPWECCHVCVALSGCCPIVVTVALGVPGAKVQTYAKKESRRGWMHPATGGVMSGQFSGLLNKWTDSSPKAGATAKLRGEREEGGWQPLLAQGESVTFDPPVEVSLPSSQLCLPRPSSSYSSLFLLKHKTLAVCSLSPLTVSL